MTTDEHPVPDTTTNRHESVRDGDTSYEPWTDGYAVGFRIIRGERVEYLYLNPSNTQDDGQPNVFVYHGTAGDAAEDRPLSHVDVVMQPTRASVSYLAQLQVSVNLVTGEVDGVRVIADSIQPDPDCWCIDADTDAELSAQQRDAAYAIAEADTWPTWD